MVDHDGAARGQIDRAGIGRFDLVLDLKAREQRRVVAVALDPVLVLGHHMPHELLGLVVDIVGVDQDVTDVAVEVIADRPDHQARLLIDQEGTLASLAGAIDRIPKLEQVIEVPLQLRRAAPNAGGAGNDGHAARVFELVHGLLEFGPVVALNAPAHAAATRVVGHQHDVAAGQRDEGGQGRALVASLFFFDLNRQLLAFPDHIVDTRLADGHAGCKVLFRDFLKGQKAVAVFAVVDKAGLQGGLDAGDHGFVDVALALLAPFDLDLVVEQFLSVDDGQAALFRLRGIDQHPFHCNFLSCTNTCPIRAGMPQAGALRTRELPESRRQPGPTLKVSLADVAWARGRGEAGSGAGALRPPQPVRVG